MPRSLTYSIQTTLIEKLSQKYNSFVEEKDQRELVVKVSFETNTVFDKFIP